jgi:ATP-dependent Clp protease ATP-binding subunit ClpA
LNVQGGVATLDDSVPVQIMMPASVVMEEHHQVQEHHQVPQHVQEMQEAVVQEAVGSPTQVPPEDPKLANRKELSKQWKSLCKRVSGQSMITGSVAFFNQIEQILSFYFHYFTVKINT